MAKVITTELQHSGASGANITLDSSKNVTCENNLTVDGTSTLTGAVTLPDNTITNAKVADDAIGVAELSATGTASATTFLRGDNAWAAAGGGKVLKVYHDNSVATRTSTDGDTWMDTYLDVAMDAFSKSSNKLLVQFELHCALFGSTTYDYASQRMNNIGTRIVWTPSGGSDSIVFSDTNDASGHYAFRLNWGDTDWEINNIASTLSQSALISPGTTDAITVKVQFKCGKDNMSTQVHAGSRSTMTVWELDY